MTDGKRILVVEDDPVTRRLLEKELEKRGYRVQTASDGVQGLTAVDAEPPDLILLDIVLPELDGMSLLHALKRRDDTKSIPVIMLTSVADPSKMVEAISSGARFFVVKPFQTPALMAKIDKALAEKRD